MSRPKIPQSIRNILELLGNPFADYERYKQSYVRSDYRPRPKKFEAPMSWFRGEFLTDIGVQVVNLANHLMGYSPQFRGLSSYTLYLKWAERDTYLKSSMANLVANLRLAGWWVELEHMHDKEMYGGKPKPHYHKVTLTHGPARITGILAATVELSPLTPWQVVADALEEQGLIEADDLRQFCAGQV